MGSVIVTWKGPCRDRDLQQELLSYLQTLAECSDARWSGPPPQRPAVLEILSRERAEGRLVLPNIRRFDEELSGKILVRTDLTSDPEALVAEAERCGVPHHLEDPLRPRHALLRLNRLRVRGLDFRLFDPRDLYPGENRMSFVFVESDAAPFLNGLLAAIDDGAWCRTHPLESIRTGDWYLQCPFIHLRYYLEEWTDTLLAWVKFFFMPDLQYWRYDDLSGYTRNREMFEELQSLVGAAHAKERVFAGILDSFEREADTWMREMTTW
jgi:hypothetical protein